VGRLHFAVWEEVAPNVAECAENVKRKDSRSIFAIDYFIIFAYI
jgi:hypothetical protein